MHQLSGTSFPIPYGPASTGALPRNSSVPGNVEHRDQYLPLWAAPVPPRLGLKQYAFTIHDLADWSLACGTQTRQPFTHHAVVPSSLSGEGLLAFCSRRVRCCVNHFAPVAPFLSGRDFCATWAQYYGDSVALGVAPVRQSRGASLVHVLAQRRQATHPLFDHVGRGPSAGS